MSLCSTIELCTRVEVCLSHTETMQASRRARQIDRGSLTGKPDRACKYRGEGVGQIDLCGCVCAPFIERRIAHPVWLLRHISLSPAESRAISTIDADMRTGASSANEKERRSDAHVGNADVRLCMCVDKMCSITCEGAGDAGQMCEYALSRSIAISCARACRETADSRDTERQQTDNIRRAWMQTGNKTGSWTNSTANTRARRHMGNKQLSGHAKTRGNGQQRRRPICRKVEKRDNKQSMAIMRLISKCVHWPRLYQWQTRCLKPLHV